jgi:hypothetical protein
VAIVIKNGRDAPISEQLEMWCGQDSKLAGFTGPGRRAERLWLHSTLRMRRRGRIASVAVPGAIIAAAAGAAAYGGTRSDHRVVFPFRIGAYKIGGTYRQAVAAFGTPSDFRRHYGGICELTWSKAGLRLSFRNPETPPCTHRGLVHGQYTAATILARRWSVDRGVRVGDSAERVMRIYDLPPASPSPSRVNLAQRAVPLANTQYIRLIDLDAIFQRGRVARFEIYYG